VNTPKPYALSVSALIRNAAGAILFVRRASHSRWHPGSWELPGGKPDPGEGIQDTVLREVAEETGLQIRLDSVAGTADFEHVQVRVAVLFFLATPLGADSVRLGKEHDAWRWVTQGEIADLALTPPAKAILTRATPATLASWFSPVG
jgi:8-oxo-dGTP diphosphatase